MSSDLIPNLKIPQAMIDPLLGQFLLRAVLRKPRSQIVESHVIERLILIRAGKHNRLLPADRVFVHLQALGADLFHHALHRRVDAADGAVTGLEVWQQNRVPCLLHAAHHAVGTDDD
jgi:hypothetical protein